MRYFIIIISFHSIFTAELFSQEQNFASFNRRTGHKSSFHSPDTGRIIPRKTRFTLLHAGVGYSYEDLAFIGGMTHNNRYFTISGRAVYMRHGGAIDNTYRDIFEIALMFGKSKSGESYTISSAVGPSISVGHHLSGDIQAGSPEQRFQALGLGFEGQLFIELFWNFRLGINLFTMINYEDFFFGGAFCIQKEL